MATLDTSSGATLITDDDSQCTYRTVTTHTSLRSDILNYFADREIEESDIDGSCGNTSSTFKMSDVIAKFPLQTVAKLEKLYDELKAENKIIICISIDSSSSSSSSNSRNRMSSYRLNLEDGEVLAMIASRQAYSIKRKIVEQNVELERKARVKKIKLEKQAYSIGGDREKENEPRATNKNIVTSNSDDGDNFFGFNSLVETRDDIVSHSEGYNTTQSFIGIASHPPNQDADFSSWCTRAAEFKNCNKIALDIVKDVLTVAWANDEDPIKMSDCKARCMDKGLAEDVFEESIKHLGECNHIFLDEGDIYQV